MTDVATTGLPPGPRAPSAVQLWQFVRRPLAWLEACAARFGDPFTARFAGLGTFVLTWSPALVKQIITGDPDQLHAGKANAILAPLVGAHSVMLLDGAAHLRERRLLSPPLRGERMQAYAPLMVEITHAELERMPVGRPFAIHGHMQAITLEVILRAVFGLRRGARMDELRRLLLALLEPPPAILAFLPARYLDFPGSPFRAFLARRAAVVRALRAIVRDRRAAPDPDGADVLSLLLAARDDRGLPMGDDQLCDELITMLVAGHETTATALSWAFACILDDPDVHARLRAGDGGDDYLDAVVKETLRLRPIVPDVVRQLQAPADFAGYRIPAGVHLTPCIHLAHRRPEAFPEPARFRPERFVGAKIDPYTWFPFGGGVRKCLGMAFALFEMKIVLATILARARLRLVAPGPVRVVRRTVTLAPAGGTRVVLDAR